MEAARFAVVPGRLAALLVPLSGLSRKFLLPGQPFILL
jgi:hypothetical protein